MLVPFAPYDFLPLEVQGTATQAPPAPPIPAMPARPGAATGGSATGAVGGGTAASGAPGGGAADARTEFRNALREARDEIRTGLREGLQDQGGTPQAIVVQPPFPPQNDIPPEVIPIVGIVFSMIAVMVIGSPIARAIARAMDRKSEASVVKAGDVVPQIRQLQESVDAMAIELERISEAQRFTAKLASERAKSLPAGE